MILSLQLIWIGISFLLSGASLAREGNPVISAPEKFREHIFSDSERFQICRTAIV